MDRPLAYALAERIWQTLTGPFTIVLLVWYLSESDTGVYTGIGKIIGIQNLFELGMLNVLIGHAGHAAAALKSADDDDASNSDRAKRRMQTLIDASGRWFAIAGLLFAVGAIAFGWYTFTRTESADHVSTYWEWLAPLLVVIPMAAMIVVLSPRLAILEGSGHRELLYRFRFYQRITGTVAVWGALLAGLGIWALVLSTFVQLLWTIYIPFVRCRGFFGKFQNLAAVENQEDSNEFLWSRDVVPAQWRAALVSMAHYLATESFLFAILIFGSREDAGRLGLTLMITMAIQAVALAWVQTKFAVISDLHGADRREEAGVLWRRTALISTGLLATGFAVLVGILVLLPQAESLIQWAGYGQKSLTTRFITPTQCAIYSVGCVASHLIGLQAIYVLARKANPLTIALMIGSLSAATAVWIGGATGGTTGLLVGYSTTMTLIALPVHTIAYKKFREQ